MQVFKSFYKNKSRTYFTALQLLFAGFICCSHFKSFAQAVLNAENCPYNIDFETGTFNGWTCYTGFVAAVNGQNVISLSPSGGPVFDRQTMYSANSGMTDQYGGFSVNCPNGSGHSIRLGNNRGGGEAEGISYEFTIPANQNNYALIYHYAVVFQDPNHEEYQQPRMEIEITNVTDNKVISCSSFTFHPFGSILPGFFLSDNPGGNTPVWCKNWSAVTINLDNNAGKTIRLFFKTADCTFQRHFGYAYIDVNSECSSEFAGATYCPNDSAIQVTAPYGYQTYTWYNNTFTKILGTQQNLKLAPPPATGTTIAVEVMPFSGYGCTDTLYARLTDTLTVKSYAGRDTFYCGNSPVQIGAPPMLGLSYSWQPATGLSDPEIANPLASPDTTTTYILTTKNYGGGCVDKDTVQVRSAGLSNTLQLIGKDAYCVDGGDSSVLKVKPADRVQWFENGVAINGADQPRYNATQSGSYYAMLFTNAGCSVTTRTQNIFIDKPKQAINYPVEYAIIDLPLSLEARKIGETVLWSPPINLDNTKSFTPVFKGQVEQLYTIQISTATGCVTVDTLLVKPIKNIEIYVPNAFTPNNDGLNDVLRPELLGIKELHYFKIFNRWGQLLFETKTNRAGWDGKLNGIMQETGVVVWVAEGVGVDGKIYTKKGTTVLVR